VIEQPREPDRFADTANQSAEIRAKNADFLRTVSRNMDQTCDSVDRVAASLQADADEADKIFKELA